MVRPATLSNHITGKIGDALNWNRLAAARTLLLTLLGFIAIAVGAFLIYVPAGYIVGGLLAVALAYLTDAPSSEVRR